MARYGAMLVSLRIDVAKKLTAPAIKDGWVAKLSIFQTPSATLVIFDLVALAFKRPLSLTLLRCLNVNVSFSRLTAQQTLLLDQCN